MLELVLGVGVAALAVGLVHRSRPVVMLLRQENVALIKAKKAHQRGDHQQELFYQQLALNLRIQRLSLLEKSAVEKFTQLTSRGRFKKAAKYQQTAIFYRQEINNINQQLTSITATAAVVTNPTTATPIFTGPTIVTTQPPPPYQNVNPAVCISPNAINQPIIYYNNQPYSNSSSSSYSAIPPPRPFYYPDHIDSIQQPLASNPY